MRCPSCGTGPLPIVSKEDEHTPHFDIMVTTYDCVECEVWWEDTYDTMTMRHNIVEIERPTDDDEEYAENDSDEEIADAS